MKFLLHFFEYVNNITLLLIKNYLKEPNQMGNNYSIKIKNISQKNLLKEIVLKDSLKIKEYIYYITKINKYFVENFKKNWLIKEFTILNILTRKEYNVVIERVETGYFFEGLEYSLEILPQIEEVLYISNVLVGSISHENNLIPNQTILLGTHDKYFSNLSQIEEEIKQKNANFIFFDFKKEEIIRVNYEQFRNKETGELRLGFECEVKDVREIAEKMSKISNFSNNVFSFPQPENNNINNKEGEEAINGNAENLNIFPQVESPFQKELTAIEIEELNCKISPDNSFCDLTANNLKEPRSPPAEKITLQTKKQYNILEREELFEYSKGKKPNPKTDLDLRDQDINMMLFGKKEKRKRSNKLLAQEGKLILKEESIMIKTKTFENGFKHESALDHSTSLDKTFLSTQTKGFKTTLNNIKKKYNKSLNIYDKLDANFNLMSNIRKSAIIRTPTSELIDEERITQRRTSSNSQSSKEKVMEENQISEIKPNTNVILIKGFYLVKKDASVNTKLKISDLFLNTINNKS
jgi:hypothetical protein